MRLIKIDEKLYRNKIYQNIYIYIYIYIIIINDNILLKY